MILKVDNSIVAKHTKFLSQFIVETGFEDLPKSVIERAKLTIVDTIGVILNGSSESEMKKFYETLPRDKEAVLLKKGFPKTCISAASFANATSACFVELDELTDTGGHCAIHILPPALALAQKLDKSGKDLITAFTLGYEVQDRIQRASKLRDGVYPHGTSGHVGATVAVGKLLGWNAEQMQQGINCAAALPLGTSYTPTFGGSSIVTTFASLAGTIAFIVKDLVESGFTGYESALGDTFGYILGKEFEPSVLTNKLGIEYCIMENNFKFHANCGMIHPAIEAAADALGFKIQHDVYPPYVPDKLINANDVISIRVTQGTDRGRRVMTYPQNKLSAKFSLPYSLAVFLVTGSVGIDSFDELLLEDPQIKLLERLVEFEVDSSLSEYKWGARILIEMKDGQVLKGERKHIYGHVANPPSNLDLKNKFIELTGGFLDLKEQDNIWNILINLEAQSSINNIFMSEAKV